MSTFSVRVRRILAIEPHPNADAIEFALVEGYRSIVKKGQFSAGQLVVYLPESAILPDHLIQELGLWNDKTGKGKLAGEQGNRITAVTLRGELSQGIVMPITRELEIAFSHTFFNFECARPLQEGDELADILGVTKYTPEIPESMQGDVFFAGPELALHFDIEDCKAYPQALQEGEEVVFTEKLHGTCTIVAVVPHKDAKPEAFGPSRNILVSSKGLAAQGLFFQDTPKNRETNVYVRAALPLLNHLAKLDELAQQTPLYILGESFGSEVQDLHYGTELSFRMFAAASGYHGAQVYWDFDRVYGPLSGTLQVQTVPVLYRGPYSSEAKVQHTDGTTLAGGSHIREGIVMTPVVERRIPTLGRVSLKSVSTRYISRKGGTEYN